MTGRVIIHDVGHGQAVHVFTPAGESIVIDLGCSQDFSPLSWLRKITDTIDLLIVTHPHGDHIDEFLLLKTLNFTVRQFWRPKWLPRDAIERQNQASFTQKLNAYFAMSDRFNVKLADNELVGNPDVSGRMSVKVHSSSGCGISNINNHSGVVVIDYANSTIIVPGDNEPPSWRALNEQSSFVSAMSRADIFMASHHGRESGYCSEIFHKKPQLCVVSDGRVQDTDATPRYGYHAQGWVVHSRKGRESQTRNCITTRSNGHIEISAGFNDATPFLAVTAE